VTLRGPEATDLDPRAKLVVYHCVRELLFNVVKHADTQTVLVAVTCGEDVVTVEVIDEGLGFDTALEPEGATQLGLPNIAESVEVLGGALHIESAPGRGTRARLILPSTLAAASAPLAPPLASSLGLRPPARDRPRRARRGAARKLAKGLP
jgi:signal transduction histidine kinase